MKKAKYEFDSKEQADEKISNLKEGNDSVIILGHIVLKEGVYEYSEKENKLIEVEAPVLSDKYHVDALWGNRDSHPYGWAKYSVNIAGTGYHCFFEKV